MSPPNLADKLYANHSLREERVSGEVASSSDYGRRSWQEDDLWGRSGRPRLKPCREWFLNQGELDLEGLVHFYREWRDLDEYGLIREKNEKIPIYKRKIIAIKCSKRGNDVYQRRVRDRFGALMRQDDVEFFPFSEVNPKVSLVFVTLTWADRGDIRESWEKNGENFNRWITNLREKYGRLSYARTWEAFENGCCHVHLMIQFHEARLLAFKTIDQEGKFVWRISEKSEFERSWPAFVDVRAVRTYSAVVRYLQKRVLKGTDKGDQQAGDLTHSLLWVFRKRAFALSGELVARLHDLIRSLRNSKPGQRDLEGKIISEWQWLGVRSAAELHLTIEQASSWTVVLDCLPPGV